VPLEPIFNFIEDFNSAWPNKTPDQVEAANEHMQGIKKGVQGSFPNLGQLAVTKTAAEINAGVEAVAPATPNNLAMLDAGGNLLDSQVESDGAGNITANLTGNVTGNVTGDLTGDVTANLITKATIPVYGKVVFNTPILKVTNTGTGNVAKTPVSISADVVTGTAVKAIIRVSTEFSALSGQVGVMEVLIGEPSETFATKTHRATYAIGFSSGNAAASDTDTVIVNLDGSQQFSYQLLGSALSNHATTIHLLGYYI